MRTRLFAMFIAVLVVTGVVAPRLVQASPAEEYTGTHFGTNNLPPGCENDSMVTFTNNVCHRMRTGMNGLDSPKIDVLIMVPASPTVERDGRIVRQAIQMWDGGIHNLSPQMGLDWLDDGLKFNVHVAVLDAATTDFTTYPIADPDIVVISSNPVGGAGIGIDPQSTYGQIVQDVTGLPTSQGPCTGLSNPFDYAAWSQVPGFDAHHEGANAGIYSEDCEGGGGNVCIAVNPAIDPVPGTTDIFSLFDLVAHEVGHCLTIGHVGDGLEGDWGKVPTNDIMSYNADPVGLNKCVSTLDVEGIAVSMSKYLDTDGDGSVTAADKLNANDPIGDNTGDAFQVQHPRDHFYASGDGAPTSCPQPDLGLLPGETTNWDSAPVATSRNDLTITSPVEDSTTPDGNVVVTGTVEHVSLRVTDPDPTETSAAFDDADDDASSSVTEITQFATSVTATTVETTTSLAALPPAGTNATSPTTYSVYVDGRQFDSFVLYGPLDGGALAWDNTAGAYMDEGTATWDTAANTVNMHIPRSYLAEHGITAPYQVRAVASFGNVTTAVPDDSAPEGTTTLGVAAPGAAAARPVGVPTVHAAGIGGSTQTVTFEHEGGNTFYPEESTLGTTTLVLEGGHSFGLDLPTPSDVEFTLDWTDTTGASDLDLAISGAATRTDGATSANPEKAVLENVKGELQLLVDPYVVADAAEGVTYTLTATITPLETADRDGDGVADADDACPDVAGTAHNGCPLPAAELVRVYVDDVAVGEQVVDTNSGPDDFSLPVTIATGTHTITVEWLRYSKVVASASRSVTYGTPTDPTKPHKKPKDKDPKPKESAAVWVTLP